MYFIRVIFFLVTFGLIHCVPIEPLLNSDSGLDINLFAKKYGYPLESHDVQTEDGYILTMHRIPHGLENANNNITRPPVLLMHGLLSSSMDWINLGPKKGLGLLLADAGYDVWLGNQRGNTWSRKNIDIDADTDSAKFFDFSFHEIGVHDLPAKIDYILNATAQESLVYVGHSQGTTSFFVMASEKPEYNDKIKLMLALAPVAYMGHFPNPFLRPIADYTEYITLFSNMFNVHEVFTNNLIPQSLSDQICDEKSEYKDVCYWVLNILTGFDWQIDPFFVPVIASNAPAGCSVKQMVHYFQEMISGNFSRYDYGVIGNLAKYGQAHPPLYNLENVTAPISLHYSDNDWMAAVEDVTHLENELPNVRFAKKVPFEQFNHIDYLWAKSVVELLYNDVLKEIKSVE